MQNREAEVLEGMIDRGGLQYVVNLLSAIAAEKAEHIRTNWQDPKTAAVWERAAGRLSDLGFSFVKQDL